VGRTVASPAGELDAHPTNRTGRPEVKRSSTSSAAASIAAVSLVGSCRVVLRVRVGDEPFSAS
jgi:hypothetical protein